MRPSAGGSGTWEIAGSCLQGAMVTLFNERTRRGAIVEDTDQNGRYLIEIEADACDTVRISQEVVSDDAGSEESASETFVIEERTPSGTVGDTCP
jgi:hypothetical protein